MCGCQAILPRLNKSLITVRNPANSLALCTKLLGTSKAPKRVIHSIFLSSSAICYAAHVWTPQSIGLLKRVENIQCRATKLILKLPFCCDVTYKTCLQLTNLLPISYWHKCLDIVFFCKAVKNLVFIDSEALPATRQSTRSTRSSRSTAITCIPKRSRTVTCQCSFFIHMCSTWNALPTELCTSHISLASFKRSLF